MAHLYLIRHGVSEANLDQSVNRREPDHNIALAPDGHTQAQRAGEVLAAHILAVDNDTTTRVRLLVSPYRRTQQTADNLLIGMNAAGFDTTLVERREINELREQSFGLFDGLSDEELIEQYPREHAYYEKHTAFQGEYFAPMPMGESRAMVCDRVRGTFGAILRNMECARPVEHTIVVSHGVTIRAFRQAWFYRPWQWTEAQPNPNNCSIMRIYGSRGQWEESELFEGFAPMHSRQEEREAGHVE